MALEFGKGFSWVNVFAAGVRQSKDFFAGLAVVPFATSLIITVCSDWDLARRTMRILFLVPVDAVLKAKGLFL